MAAHTPDRMLYSITEASEQLGGLSRARLYQLIADGLLRPTKVGRRTFIARAELERFIEAASDPWQPAEWAAYRG